MKLQSERWNPRRFGNGENLSRLELNEPGERDAADVD
jgi:hypothetical protein